MHGSEVELATSISDNLPIDIKVAWFQPFWISAEVWEGTAKLQWKPCYCLPRFGPAGIW